jgi:hypothetical protein
MALSAPPLGSMQLLGGKPWYGSESAEATEWGRLRHMGSSWWGAPLPYGSIMHACQLTHPLALSVPPFGSVQLHPRIRGVVVKALKLASGAGQGTSG